MGNYRDYTDQQLTALLKNSDHGAFTEIFDRYNSLLYIHAFKKLRDREAAKDVVQDTLSALWHKHETLDVANNLGGYLYTTLKHKIFDLLARQQVGQKHVVALQEYLDKGNFLADHLVREKQLAAIIEKEIAALPPRMREAFELSRKENLSHKQIAERMAISEQTVTDQVKKALKILKPRIGLVIAALYFIR
ncbi:RNA polymerase sigma-70 factor (family 1) [Pedobacter africanus]|uniref:RNA polymerase sigma-70 factor (ECF subfamily) n=1 Tax=Pedobacter africanus TaxID=151894 RepID=A0ACC6KYX6_9SPHI|nr:RNA polymerase sigma-70 factor [Pedobacter africanus]MDR6784328.1 RNA polymerase sigma-70 factor (ECF subfamily) [Pedobacter africanus]